MKYIVVKDNQVVASAAGRSIKAALTKMFGDDWEAHNVLGYLVVNRYSTGENLGVLYPLPKEAKA